MRFPNSLLLFIHSSNEMYGTDRIFLQVLATVPAAERGNVLVWLPDDSIVVENSLTDELMRLHISFEVKSLPILRRRYLSLLYALSLPRSITKLSRDISSLHPKMVYLATSATLLCAFAAKLAGVKRIILHCQEIWGERETRILGILASPVTKCVCISNAVKDSLSGRVSKRAHVILNGVPDNARPLISLETRVGRLKFLVASRWTVRKGYITLLKAWDTRDPIGELTIAGGPPEMGQTVDVIRLVDNLISNEYVHIVGEVRDISKLIDEADFVLVPSDEPEGFGLVAIEAFARGRAVIASDGGGLAEIVEEGLTGVLVHPKDSQALRDTIQGLDRVIARRMGRSAREAFELRYTLDAFDRRFADFWTDQMPFDYSPTGG